MNREQGAAGAGTMHQSSKSYRKKTITKKTIILTTTQDRITVCQESLISLFIAASLDEKQLKLSVIRALDINKKVKVQIIR